MEDAEKLEMNRYESSRLHSEILALVESIKLPEGEKITLQRNAQIGNFRADLFNSNLNLVLDIDTLSRPTSLVLKHRRISSAFKPVALSYWDLRKMKSFEEQQEWIKSKILKALKKKC
jgi:hypothetical protein